MLKLSIKMYDYEKVKLKPKKWIIIKIKILLSK